jgi:hypothetical protein
VEEDEAAEILSAMLGLAPPDAAKKKRKSGAKVRGAGRRGGSLRYWPFPEATHALWCCVLFIMPFGKSTTLLPALRRF